MDGSRSTPITGHVYKVQNTNARNREIEEAIYCTCWDGNIVIRANSEGKYRVTVETDPTANLMLESSQTF